MLKNIFFISANEFLALTIKEALKKQGVDCYTLTSSKDCFYLLEDLKPQIIFMDAPLYLTESESLFLGMKERKIEIPLILAGTEDEKAKVMNGAFLGFLIKPLAPFKIKENLEKYFLPQ
ncbi:MAG: hypothetical protein ACOYL6_01645 [Bacteriovoracaceae bacterium]